MFITKKKLERIIEQEKEALLKERDISERFGYVYDRLYMLENRIDKIDGRNIAENSAKPLH